MDRSLVRRFSAIVAIGSLMQTAMAPAFATPILTAQPPSNDPLVAQYFRDPNAGAAAAAASTAAPSAAATQVSAAAALTNAQMGALVRQKIRRVFVIFNENQSFDHEYGTFPGVNGIYSDGQNPRVPGLTPGYLQYYQTADGVGHYVTPFLLGPGQNGNVVDSVDHSHTGLATKLHIVGGVPHMDSFSEDEYLGKSGTRVTAASDALGRQFANIVMSHIDCNTIPFFWQYANRFVIFDNIFATEDTPSAPNAVAMIAGQSGETQWVKHGPAGFTGPVAGTINGTTFKGMGTTQGVPLVNDPQPFYGSEFDVNTPAQYKEPTSPSESFGITNIEANLTFANVLLTLGGTGVKDLLSGDLHKPVNQADIQNDINTIFATGNNAVSWRWYQNGYDHEPTDPTSVATHVNWVSHHEGPEYFGYIANNVNEQPNLRGEGDFFTDLANGTMPQGVVYIRGGYQNIVGLRSSVQNGNYPAPLTATDVKTIQTAKAGDDDHPSYSDRMISEAATARVINAIASNPAMWAESAIIITYDESDGFWDHVPPRILSYGPDGLPLSRGIRVPLIVISPYGYAHVVSHAEGDHNAIIETINAIFNLPPLSTLPDEASALIAGNSAAFNAFGPPGFQQLYLGPRDTNSPITDSLLSAFDPSKLTGTTPILPASYAMIPDAIVNSLPHYGTMGCQGIGMTPEDIREGISAPPPANFNPLAATLPAYNIPYPN